MADALALHRKMFEVVMARDYDGLRALLHPDYVYMTSDGVEQKGADAAVAVPETYFAAFPDMTFEFPHEHAVSDSVSVIEFHVSGTHTGPLGDIPATGKRAEVHVCNVIEVRDGLIYREREYFDTLPMLQQLGIA